MNAPTLITTATDTSSLGRLRALAPDDAETTLRALEALPSPEARQDHLISARRIALSVSALETWMREARAACGERQFRGYLAEVQQAATRAEEFRGALTRAETLHQVNVTLLAARLFDALVARDAAAIEQLAHSFAEVVQALTPDRQAYHRQYPYDPAAH